MRCSCCLTHSCRKGRDCCKWVIFSLSDNTRARTPRVERLCLNIAYACSESEVLGRLASVLLLRKRQINPLRSNHEGKHTSSHVRPCGAQPRCVFRVGPSSPRRLPIGYSRSQQLRLLDHFGGGGAAGDEGRQSGVELVPRRRKRGGELREKVASEDRESDRRSGLLGVFVRESCARAVSRVPSRADAWEKTWRRSRSCQAWYVSSRPSPAMHFSFWPLCTGPPASTPRSASSSSPSSETCKCCRAPCRTYMFHRGGWKHKPKPSRMGSNAAVCPTVILICFCS